MAKLRRKQRQSETARPPVARKPKPQVMDQNPLEAQQHAMGNQAVQRMLESRAVQAKLTVSPPNDAYEQEADRVAGQVMGTAPPSNVGASGASPGIQRETKDEKKKPEAAGGAKGKQEAPKKEGGAKEGPKEKKKEEDKAKRKPILDDEKKEEEEPVQREAAEAEVPAVSPELEASLDAQQGGGEPLPEGLRAYFESRMGEDLSGVRIHTDHPAAQAAAELEAQAFTRGEHIFFGAGYFEPQSNRGKWLLAHELTHTVQQTREPGTKEGEPSSGRYGPAFPIEARAATGVLVARKEDEEEPPETK